MNVLEASVIIKLVDQASAGLAGIALSCVRTQTAADALQSRLNKIHSIFSRGTMMIGGGLAMAAPLLLCVKSAQQLETALARVKIQTGASTTQMETLSKTFGQVANATGVFSKVNLAGFASEMYSGGITSVKQINDLLPVFAKAADVTKLMSGGKIGVNDTLHTLTALSHQFGKYDTKGMTDIANATVAMALQLPGGMKSLLGTGSTVNVPGNRQLGIDPTTLIAYQAAVAQTSGSTGAGGKGRMSATNQIEALMRSVNGKSLFAGKVLGLKDMFGASTIMKGNKLDFMKLRSTLAADEKLSSLDLALRMKQFLPAPAIGKRGKPLQVKQKALRQLIDRDIASGGTAVSQKELFAKLMSMNFGSASTVGTLLGDSKFASVMDRMKSSGDKAIKAGAVDKMQAEIMKTLDAQTQRLITSMITLSSTIGMQLIPSVTRWARKTADALDAINKWAEANPKVVKTIAGVIAVTSALLILGGVINVIASGFMGLQLVLGPVFRVIMMIIPTLIKLWPLINGIRAIALLCMGALGPLLVPILAITAAITLIVVVVMNWNNIMKVIQPIIANVTKAFWGMVPALANLLAQIGGFVAMVPGMAQLGKNMQGAATAAKMAATLQQNNLAHPPGADQSKGGAPNLMTAANNKARVLPHGQVAASQKAPVVHQTNNIHVTTPAGHDHEKCVDHIGKSLARKLNHVASAKVGPGGVGVSRYAFGATQ